MGRDDQSYRSGCYQWISALNGTHEQVLMQIQLWVKSAKRVNGNNRSFIQDILFTQVS